MNIQVIHAIILHYDISKICECQSDWLNILGKTCKSFSSLVPIKRYVGCCCATSEGFYNGNTFTSFASLYPTLIMKYYLKIVYNI